MGITSSQQLSPGLWLCHQLTFQATEPYPPPMIEMEAYSLLCCELPPHIEYPSMPRAPDIHLRERRPGSVHEIE